MRVEELMSDARCCGPGDTVQECARLMRDEDIGFVPICDRDGKPIGAITDRDLAIRVLADGRTAAEKLQAFMTKDIVGCRIGDDVSDAQRLMASRKVSRVMVCDDSGKLRGVIGLQDLAEQESEESTGRTITEVKSDQPSMTH